MAAEKTILITGATGGIGSALAEYYAAANTCIIITGRNPEKLNTVAQRCERKGAVVIQKQADVTDHPDFSDWIKTIDTEHPIDLLIANAGVSSFIAANRGPETIDTIRAVIDTNVNGVINTVTPIVTSMRERRRGQIVIVSSLAAYRGLPQSPAYCASKAAIKSYGEALRAWLKPDGIKVNVICPGFVKTAMSDKLSTPKPMMVSAEKAAVIIARGLAKDKPVISFPGPLAWLSRLSMALPSALVDHLLNKNMG
ncbi:MAG: SDR family NAD(P)-dependent oxidoreductase [Gammaproteobacteria bacterium]|nr:SDR family NAD(P)-dependent oxidoreductase [Gammaproteobacteria bacterium]MCH9745077.1 SDR family NAD(P)-dependent oxidoreductase [Gammaproteobacteria bacterium]